ncbi:MAG: AMP-binding protein [Myxococcales bacterium]|nr:AMP-binding protein [Myxococcales bacterium]
MVSLPLPHLAAARARPDHPALVGPGGTLTWGAFAARVARRAAALIEQGVGPGTVVGLIGPATPAWLVECFAVGHAGAAVAPLDVRAPAAELKGRLRAAAPTFVSAPEAAHLSPPQREALATAGAARLLVPGLGAEAAPERFWPLDEVRWVILTSGTTRRPRPVRLTTAQLVFSAFGSATRLGLDPADRWLACLPLHHVGGLSIPWRCAWAATTVELHPGFDPPTVAARLDSGQVALASLTPSMLQAVLDARPEGPLPAAVRAILIGGAAAPEALVDRCRRLGLPVALTWGMTEAGSQISTRHPGDLDPASGAGAPLPFAVVQADAQGALTVHGPLVGGTLTTQDHGYVDERGRVHVGGRRDDVIVSGGVNLSPAEIEQALLAHPAVADAGVVGVPDAQWGARPVAALVAAGAARPSLEALQAWCRARLAPYKAPDRVVWLDALPRDGLGKLSRARLGGLIGRNDAQGLHGLDEGGRPGHRLELGEAHVGVLQPHHGAHVGGVALADHRVAEGDRALGPALDDRADHQRVAPAGGAGEVALHVHQRQPEAHPLEGALARGQGPVQQGLEGLVGVLEVAPEEDHPRGIHLVEAGGDPVLEGHLTTLSGSPEEP